MLTNKNKHFHSSYTSSNNLNGARPSTGGWDSQADDIYERNKPNLERQNSNPQLSNRDQQQQLQLQLHLQQQQQSSEFKRLSQPNIVTNDHRIPINEEQMVQQQNPLSSIRTRGAQGPPKPPRIITTLRKTPLADMESNQTEPPAKPPRYEYIFKHRSNIC